MSNPAEPLRGEIGDRARDAEHRPDVTKDPSKLELLQQGLVRFIPHYRRLLPQHYEAGRLITGALIACRRTPGILNCPTESIAIALAQVAQWGLDIGTTAHLVPYYDKVKKVFVCTPVADYKGYVELIVRAGARKVEGRAVYMGDHFEYGYGTEPYIRHVSANAGTVVTHGYAIVWLASGVFQFEVLTAGEIDAIRQQKSHQWKDGPLPAWYARKTAIRQVAKYVPKTRQLVALAERDEAVVGSIEELLEAEREAREAQRPRIRPVHNTDDPYPKAAAPASAVAAEEPPQLTEEEIAARDQELDQQLAAQEGAR